MVQPSAVQPSVAQAGAVQASDWPPAGSILAREALGPLEARLERPLYSLVMETAVLVLAAGRGLRLGAGIPKAYVPLRGRTLLERSLDILLRVPGIDHLQPVLAREDQDRYRALVGPTDPRLAAPVVGGAERQDSVAAGLAALPEAVEWVMIHDAARCLVRVEAVERVLALGRECGAALLAIPIGETLKRVRAGAVEDSPDRALHWLAQTPQVFRRGLLEEGLAKARSDGFNATDDAQLVERLGVVVRVAEGHPENLKITRPSDLLLAESWLAAEGDAA